MKKIQLLEALRNIRRSWVSFLSIIVISLIAVLAYLGVTFAAESLKRSVAFNFTEANTEDVSITFSGLVKEKELQTIAATGGVGEVEGIVLLPSRIRTDGDYQNIMVYTPMERISRPALTEGRLPETSEECAVEELLAEKMGYRVGDTLNLSERNARTDMLFRKKSFTITGFFTNALHGSEKFVDAPWVLVHRDTFNSMFLSAGTYTGALIRLRDTGLYRFSEEWKQQADAVKDRLKALDDSWTVTTLETNGTYIAAVNFANLLSRISLTFSLLFIFIAGLVTNATVCRLAKQDTKLIGATKAMGLYNREIGAKYMLFGLGGTLLGTLLGAVLSSVGLAPLIVFFFSISMLDLPHPQLVFLPQPACIVLAGAIVLTVAAVLTGLGSVMRASAVSMMSGQTDTGRRMREARSSGRRLYSRLIFRNMRTDWQRVLVSVLSVAGCLVLILVGFSMRYAVTRIPNRQYRVVQQYQHEVETEPEQAPEVMAQTGALLEEAGLDAVSVGRRSRYYACAGKEGNLILLTMADETATDYFRLLDAYSGTPISLPEDGVLVNRWFLEECHVAVGDTLTMYDSDLKAHEVKVAGYLENHLEQMAVGRRSSLEAYLGEELEENIWLVKDNGTDLEALKHRLAALPGFLRFGSAQASAELFDVFSLILNLVILLMTFLAIVIACFILMNLINTCITDKKSELIIMRINGYSTRDTIRYASLENYGSLVLGILLGMGVGTPIAGYIIRQIEQQHLALVREPALLAYLFSAGLTAAIVLTVQWISMRKVRDMKLSDLRG